MSNNVTHLGPRAEGTDEMENLLQFLRKSFQDADPGKPTGYVFTAFIEEPDSSPTLFTVWHLRGLGDIPASFALSKVATRLAALSED